MNEHLVAISRCVSAGAIALLALLNRERSAHHLRPLTSNAHLVRSAHAHNVAMAKADVHGTDPPMDCAWNPRAPIAAGGLGGHPTFPPERFECPAGVFFFVGVTVIADEEFRPRRCLWSHPLARGEIVTRFHDVPLGHVIRGHGGISWMTERELRGAPVTLTVRVDGDAIGSFTHRDGEGWRGFEMPLGAHAGARARDIEFAVTTPNYKDRHFCFEADTR